MATQTTLFDPDPVAALDRDDDPGPSAAAAPAVLDAIDATAAGLDDHDGDDESGRDGDEEDDAEWGCVDDACEGCASGCVEDDDGDDGGCLGAACAGCESCDGPVEGRRWAAWEDEGLPEGMGDRLAAAGLADAAATREVDRLAGDLDARLARQPAELAVDGFLAAGDGWADRLDRRAVLRIGEVLSMLPVAALSWPGWAHPDPHARRRPLRPVELTLVRLVARRGRLLRGLAVAVAEAGAASGELALLRVADAAVDADGKAWLALPGCRRARPRRRPLPGWARPLLQGRQETVDGDQARLLLYDGASSDDGRIQSAVLMQLGAALGDAGLTGDPSVAPLSLRNTTGRAIHETSGIEAAADALGAARLDPLRAELGLVAHQPPRRRRR